MKAPSATRTARNIVSIALSLVIFLISIPYCNRQNKKDFQTFYSSPLKGKIFRLQTVKPEVLELDNSNVEYRFTSQMTWFNNNKTFSQTASMGDSVYKAAWSDTIYLKKADGTMYRFTFLKLR